MTAEHRAAHQIDGGDDQVGSDPTVPAGHGGYTDAAPFQVMPTMSDQDMQALVDDIAANGVRVPIDVDVHGRILDGHHRAAACRILGIQPPKRVVEITTDDEARTHAFSVNTTRRHLSREQRRDLIARSLILDPALSDRAHAQRCGASPSTVGAVRKHLADIGQLSKLDTRVGLDGRQRTTGPKWPYPTPELLDTAMRPHGLDRVQSLTARLPLPGMPSWQWDEFVDSIAEQGVMVPVLVTRDGMLVDGRLRLIAAHLTDTDASIKVLSDDADPQAVSMGQNIYRHSITESQVRARFAGLKLTGQILGAVAATDEGRAELTALLIAGGMTETGAGEYLADLDAILATRPATPSEVSA